MGTMSAGSLTSRYVFPRSQLVRHLTCPKVLFRHGARVTEARTIPHPTTPLLNAAWRKHEVTADMITRSFRLHKPSGEKDTALEQFDAKCTAKWGKNPSGMLTDVGLRQMIDLGQRLRLRYWEGPGGFQGPITVEVGDPTHCNAVISALHTCHYCCGTGPNLRSDQGCLHMVDV